MSMDKTTPDAPPPVTQADIDAAIKVIEYKYFGYYEMSDDQRAAVDTLVAFARHRHLSREGVGMRDRDRQYHALLIAMLDQVRDEGGDMMRALNAAAIQASAVLSAPEDGAGEALVESGHLGWDADGMCDDHYAFACPKCALQPDKLGEDWRHKLRMVISHASGGHLSEETDADRPLNDICVQISQHHNRIWQGALDKAAREAPTPSHIGNGGEDVDYVAELAAVMKEEGFRIPGKDLSDPKIAEEIYKVHMHLKDPINNLIGRIGGQLFLKSDAVMCMENKRDVRDFEKIIELTEQEKMKVRSLKEDIDLLTECKATIERLSTPTTTEGRK